MRPCGAAFSALLKCRATRCLLYGSQEGAIERERSALEARQQDEQRFAQESEANQVT